MSLASEDHPIAVTTGPIGDRVATLLGLAGHAVTSELAGTCGTVVIDETAHERGWPAGPTDRGRPAGDAGTCRHVVEVSAWGRGARSDWPASDADIAAAGGWSGQIGFPNGPPITPPGEQAFALTAVAAAFAVLAPGPSDAHHRRSEVAAVDVVAATLETGALTWIHEHRVAPRPGRDHSLVLHQLVPASDGWIATGLGGNPSMFARLREWFAGEGEFGLDDPRFDDPTARLAGRPEIAAVIERFCAARTRADLTENAQTRRIPWAAVLTRAEATATPQFVARQALGRVPWLTTIGPVPPRGVHPACDSVAGARVLDLTWVLAGPFATRLLADHGADVVKVESSARPDPTRFSPSMHLGRGREPGTGETSGYFANHNRNKRSLALDLGHPDGPAVLHRLIAGADVVIDNFSAGTLAKWGLDPEALWRLRPDLVIVEMSGLGQTGPWRNYVSYADAVSALSGLTASTTDEHGEPVGVVFGLGDLIAGYYGAFAVASALRQRAADGRGRYIDLSQLEAVACHLGLALDSGSGATGPTPGDEVVTVAAADGRQLVEEDATVRAVPFYGTAEHPVIGPHLVELDPIIVDGARPAIARPAPLLGEHTEDVLREFGSYDDDDIRRLAETGVLR